MPSRSHGLTLIELAIALAVAAVLLALAAPAFTAMSRTVRLETSVDEMLGALYFAQGAALRRGIPAAVCLTSDMRQCVGRPGAPAIGWLVFQDLRRESPVAFSAEDELLRMGASASGVSVRGTRTAVTYWPASRAGTTATFAFCFDRLPGEARAIVVSQTGRPRLARAGAGSCEP